MSDLTLSGPVVGIDVSKASLDVAFSTGSPVVSFPNSLTGRRALGKHLLKAAPSTIVLEATGGYEKDALHHLLELNLPAVRVNPRQVRDFAKALGFLAKTDTIDARVLAKFGECVKPAIRAIPSPEIALLKELVTRRTQLIDYKTSENNRQEHRPCAAISKSIRKMVDTIEKQLAILEDEIKDLIAQHKRLERAINIMDSVPGVGLITAAAIAVGMPEIGTISRQQAAALAGLAPYNQDSGQFKGQRSIRGGRAAVRSALYMATLTAVRCNPVLKEDYQRLVATKVPKVALTACMRKLITILNALVRDDCLWGEKQTPNPIKAT